MLKLRQKKNKKNKLTLFFTESDPVIQFQPFICCICLKYNRFEKNLWYCYVSLTHSFTLLGIPVQLLVNLNT